MINEQIKPVILAIINSHHISAGDRANEQGFLGVHFNDLANKCSAHDHILESTLRSMCEEGTIKQDNHPNFSENRFALPE